MKLLTITAVLVACISAAPVQKRHHIEHDASGGLNLDVGVGVGVDTEGIAIDGSVEAGDSIIKRGVGVEADAYVYGDGCESMAILKRRNSVNERGAGGVYVDAGLNGCGLDVDADADLDRRDSLQERGDAGVYVSIGDSDNSIDAEAKVGRRNSPAKRGGAGYGYGAGAGVGVESGYGAGAGAGVGVGVGVGSNGIEVDAAINTENSLDERGLVTLGSDIRLGKSDVTVGANIGGGESLAE